MVLSFSQRKMNEYGRDRAGVFLYRPSFQVRIRVVGTPAGRSVRSSGSGTGAEGGGWQPWAEAELLMRHGGAAAPPTAGEEPLIPFFSSSSVAVEQQRSLPPSTEPGKPAGLPPSARCCLSACLSSSVLQCRASWLDMSPCSRVLLFLDNHI